MLTGLEAGERVVTEGVDRLRDGMQVKVAGSPAAEAGKTADKPAAKPVTNSAGGAGA